MDENKEISEVEQVSGSYEGYKLFNDVEDKKLQSWNRSAVMFNMCTDGKKDLVRGYIGAISEEDRVRVMVVLAAIKQNGYSQTKRDLIRVLH